MTPFEMALVVHLVCDWLLQNEWMALNKTSLRHPAAWVHGGIHALGLMLVFPALVALLIGVVHMLIDEHSALREWRKLIHQTSDPEQRVSLHISIWADQVAHIAVLGLAVYWIGGAA